MELDGTIMSVLVLEVLVVQHQLLHLVRRILYVGVVINNIILGLLGMNLDI
jgi:hypothetical protein